MGNGMLGRTALVTGSTDGIGVGIAAVLAAHGAQVVVSSRNVARGEEVVAAIADKGGRATSVRADLQEGTAAARELADAAHDLAGGPLDVLVNNAAMLIASGRTEDVDEAVIDAAFAVNVKAAFLLTGLVAPRMAARGQGAIVNIGSINGLVGMAGSALYSATKATIHSLTKSWAAEYGPRGVRVNTVAPGPTRTRRNEEIAEHLGPIIARAPSRRLSTTDEVGEAVLYLASDAASNVHAATLSVDGGWAAV